MEKIDYWQKLSDTKTFDDLIWNIPEQKTGTVNIVGGHQGGFFAPIKDAEYLMKNFPVKTVNVLLPDSLKTKLPLSDNFIFLDSTDSGSIDKSPLLNGYLDSADFTIISGDLSKNSATTIAISEALESSSKPVLVTRDGIDLTLPEMSRLIERNDLFLVGTIAQIQKVFRAVYYPKVILFSMPLIPIIEALHKFTLSYPTTILTYHNDQVIVADKGKIVTLPLDKTAYSRNAISLWMGDLASKITALNLYNPNKKLEATTLALTYGTR